jgi:hypothetical protein
VCVGCWAVSESGDHGPFNSWDRQVYVTEVRTGQPDVIKEWDDISHNFFIANYNSQEAIDNDDGSWCVVCVEVAGVDFECAEAALMCSYLSPGCLPCLQLLPLSPQRDVLLWQRHEGAWLVMLLNAVFVYMVCSFLCCVDDNGRSRHPRPSLSMFAE